MEGGFFLDLFMGCYKLTVTTNRPYQREQRQ